MQGDAARGHRHHLAGQQLARRIPTRAQPALCRTSAGCTGHAPALARLGASPGRHLFAASPASAQRAGRLQVRGPDPATAAWSSPCPQGPRHDRHRPARGRHAATELPRQGADASQPRAARASAAAPSGRPQDPQHPRGQGPRWGALEATALACRAGLPGQPARTRHLQTRYPTDRATRGGGPLRHLERAWTVEGDISTLAKQGTFLLWVDTTAARDGGSPRVKCVLPRVIPR